MAWPLHSLRVESPTEERSKAMRKFFLTAAVAAALTCTVPTAAKASWLSEYLHNRLDPVPAYPYYNPAYSNYYAPGDAVPYYYGYEGPSYGYHTYGRPPYAHGWHDWHNHGYAGHHNHDWHGHGEWHGHEGHHHH
jgi:hypothetical protein